MATMLTPESDDSLTPLGAIGGLIPGARGAATTGARNRHPSRHFTAPRGTSAPLPSHAGWLEKLRPEGHGFSLKTRKWQRRYFRLRDGELRWSHTEDSIDEESDAHFELKRATVDHGAESLQFKLMPCRLVAAASSKIRSCYDLRAVNAEEARRWTGLIDRTIQQLQWRADIHDSGVFRARGGVTFDNSPVRQFSLNRGSSLSIDSGRSSASSGPPPSPGLREVASAAAVAASARTFAVRSPLPADGARAEEGVPTRLLSTGEIEPMHVVGAKLKAYEASRWVGDGSDFDILGVEHRRLLKAADAHDAETSWTGGRKTRRIFLFNDSLLIVHPYSDEMYEFLALLPIEELTMEGGETEQVRLVLPAAEGRDEEKWSVCFSSAGVAADWRSDIDDIARRRNHGLRHAALAPTSTPGSSQELRLRTRSGRLLEEVQDEPEKTVWAGELELQVQGSVGWLDVFAHAREGHLHLYNRDKQGKHDCPFPFAPGEGGRADAAMSPEPEPEAGLQERLLQRGFSAGFAEIVCSGVLLSEVEDYGDDLEFWEQMRQTEPLQKLTSAMDAEWQSFVSSLGDIASNAGPGTPRTVLSRRRSLEVEALVQLSQSLTDVGMGDEAHNFVGIALQADPTDVDALHMRDELRNRGHTSLLSVNLGELVGIEAIELSYIGTSGLQQITIRNEKHGVIRLRPTTGTLEVWRDKLQRIYAEAAALFGTPKYEHMCYISQTTTKLVQAYMEALGAASALPSPRRRKSTPKQGEYIEAKFQAAFAHVCGGKDPERWRDWIGKHIVDSIGQADELMDDLALGLAQAGGHNDCDQIREWFATEVYDRFMKMLRAFGSRFQELRKTSSRERSVTMSHSSFAADDLDSSIASTVALEEIEPENAMAIIGWCRRFNDRCLAMGIRDGMFEEDPTETEVYLGLQRSHQPPYKGFLKMKGVDTVIAITGWQRRYFSLANSKLRYFKTKQMLAERGCIEAQSITALERDGQTIKITASGKVHELWAAKEDEAAVWEERLSKARDSAHAQERLMSHETVCFEVQAFEGQQQVAAHAVTRDCEALFANAKGKLQLQAEMQETAQSGGGMEPEPEPEDLDSTSSLARANLYIEAGHALLEILDGRMERIPVDRPDVRMFYALEYHKNIAQYMEEVRGLSAWPARDVCRLMFWARHCDQVVERKAGRRLTAGEKPLGGSAVWCQELPGFDSQKLPRYADWVVKQRFDNHSWERCFIIVENMRVTWHEADATEHDDQRENTLTELVAKEKEIRDNLQDAHNNGDPSEKELEALLCDVLREIKHGPGSSGRPHKELVVQGSFELSGTTKIKSDMNRREGEDFAHIKISADQDFVNLRVPRDNMPQLLQCLNDSINPMLPGETASGGDDFGQTGLSEKGTKIVADHQRKSDAELKQEIADDFRQRFRAKTEEIRLASGSSYSDFTLDTVLELFSLMLEDLVEVVDEVLFSGRIDEKCINDHIVWRHEQFEMYFNHLCQSEAVLPGTDVDVTVTKNDVVKLLKWASSYHARITSIGLHNAADVLSLQKCCDYPMSEYVRGVSKALEDWLSRLLPSVSLASRTEQVVQSQDGLYKSSMPADLFRMIFDATKRASESASQPLLVDTVMGAIIPQVRVWARMFEEELKGMNGEVWAEYSAEVSYERYLCACLNNMDTCYRQTARWSEEVEDRLEDPGIMLDEDAELNTDQLRDCFRSIHDVALDGLLAWIMEPMKPFLQDITTVDWVKHSKMRLMLDTLAICCTELERYILPRVFKKVMDMVMHSLIDLYVKELLKLARTEKQRKRARHGKAPTHLEFAAFMTIDIDLMTKFFCTYLKDNSVRAALQSADAVMQLHQCDIQDDAMFVATCSKWASIWDGFSASTVTQVLDAREDVMSGQREQLLAEATEVINMIRGIANPKVPSRDSDAELSSSAGPIPAVPVTPGNTSVQLEDSSADGAQPKHRVLALQPFSAEQAGDLNFERGTVIVVTESSGAFWEGYVERLADGTIMTPPDEGEVTTGKFPPNFVQELGVERADSPAQAPEVDADAAQQGDPPVPHSFLFLPLRLAQLARGLGCRAENAGARRAAHSC